MLGVHIPVLQSRMVNLDIELGFTTYDERRQNLRVRTGLYNQDTDAIIRFMVLIIDFPVLDVRILVLQSRLVNQDIKLGLTRAS